jgi:opacity protein-like surface antigen
MKKLNTKILLIFILFSSAIIAQYNGSDFSVSTNFSYNTTAKIFLTPNAEYVLDQNKYFEIEGVYSYSFELRYRLNESILFGLSAEYMKGSGKGRNLSSNLFVVKDGFELVPIELSIFYFLPFSTEDFKFFMGGGIGFYSGKRTREFGTAKFVNVKNDLGYGIQVNVGMDYMILKNISVRGELRFRDPDFKITNKYDSEIVVYEGRTYSIQDNNIISKLNLDGITFRIGFAFHLSLFN